MKSKGEKSYRGLKWAAFCIYLFALSYFLFFSEGFGRTELYEEYRYNLVPFQEIKRFFYYSGLFTPFQFAVNIIGNIFVFTPYGIFISMLRRKRSTFLYVLIWSALFSLIVETIQLLTKVGIFDIDDIIMNTFGALIGFFLYCIFSRSRRSA